MQRRGSTGLNPCNYVKSAVGNALHGFAGRVGRGVCALLPCCGWGLIPVGQDLLRFHHLLLGTSEIEFQFSRLARDLNFDGFQAVAFHAGAELFVGFVGAVFLEAIAHG